MVVIDLKTSTIVKKKDKLVRKLKKRFEVDIGETGTTKEGEEVGDDKEEDDNEKEEDELKKGPL